MSSIIFFSVSKSKELVASSNTKSLGSKYKALAIPILCLWPPDNLTPDSPTTVSRPFVNESTKFLSCVLFKEFFIVAKREKV